MSVRYVSTFVNACATLDRMAPSTQTAKRATVLDGCCSRLTDGVLEVDVAEQLARGFKALGDATRVRLLSLIAATDDGEACICNLTEPVNLSQPTVSHHMKLLADAGLVIREQRGKWAYYRLVPDTLNALSQALIADR